MTRRVLIAGAGAAGLAAAWWLSRAGWEITLVERAPDLRTDGYMLGLSGPGYEIVRRMGLLPDLEARARHIHENLYIDRDGRELARLRYGEFFKNIKWVTLSRTDLIAVLYDAARDAADYRFGTTLTGMEQDPDGADVTLSDGSTHRFDLVIGADGMHSPMRKQLFGDAAEHYEFLGYRFAAFQVADAQGLGHDFLSYSEPGRHTEFYALNDGWMSTLYVWRSAESGFVPHEARRESLRAAFAGTHPGALAPIDALSGDGAIVFDDLTMVTLPLWSRGRCVLLGDAAHCLTLVSGQGAGVAISSAAILADELRTNNVMPALARHENRVRPVVARLQERSRRLSRWFIPATPGAYRRKNLLLKYAPRPLMSWVVRRGIQNEIIAAERDLVPPGLQPPPAV